MTDDIFSLAVPADDLKAPTHENMPAGLYVTTMQPGASIAENTSGWKGVRLPFAGFEGRAKGTNGGAPVATGKNFPGKSLNAQFTVELATSPEAVKIGMRGLMGAAQAFGLTEEVEIAGEDGTPKKALKLLASGYPELVQQLNEAAGHQVLVYVALKPRKRNGAPVLNEDQTPVLDNEIQRVQRVQ